MGRRQPAKSIPPTTYLLALDLLFLWVAPARIAWLFVALTTWAFATDIVWPSQQRRIVELTPLTRGKLNATIRIRSHHVRGEY